MESSIDGSPLRALNWMEQQAEARRWIELQESQIQILHKKIRMISDQIDLAKAQQIELEEALYYRRSLSAPISRIPVEILTIIFIFCVDDSETPRPYDIALVCRRWKEIAFDTPQLWRRVELAVNQPKSEDWKTVLFYPWRAKTLPLDISIDLTRVKFISSSRVFVNCFCTILKQFQWRSLDIKCPHDCSFAYLFIPFLECLCDRDWSSTLETFRLQLEPLAGQLTRLRQDEWDIVEKAFSNTTNLTTLLLPNQLLWSSHPVTQRLKHLELYRWSKGLNGHAGGQFISRCRVLQTLRLQRTTFSHSSQPVAPFTLSELHSFDLDGVQPLRDTLIKLNAPKLRHLRIKAHPAYKFLETNKTIQSVLPKMSYVASLRSLTLSGLGCTPKTLITVLESTIALEELYIDDWGKPVDKVVYALAKPGTARRRWLCPGLQRFHLSSHKAIRLLSTDSARAFILNRHDTAGSVCTTSKSGVAMLEEVTYNGQNMISEVLGEEGWVHS